MHKQDLNTQGRSSEAVESLLTLEKQNRLAEDITGTKMCCQAILEVLVQARDWQQLNEHILLLAKRRSQLKQVIVSCTCLRASTVTGQAFILYSGLRSKTAVKACRACAGCPSICQASNGLRGTDTKHRNKSGAHKDATICHRGQSELRILVPACICYHLLTLTCLSAQVLRGTKSTPYAPTHCLHCRFNPAVLAHSL